VFAKSKIKSVASETNFLKSKKRDITTNLLKFAISETTLYCWRDIITKNLSSSTFTKFKNLSITLIVLNCEKDNVDRRALSF